MLEYIENSYKEKWMNRDIMEKIIDKDIALKIAKRTKEPDDIIYAKRIKNEVGKLIEKTKRNFLVDEFENAKGDPKRFWKNIYSIIPNSKLEKKKDLIHLKNDNNCNIAMDDTSRYINDYFINIGPKLAEKFNDKWEFHGKEEENIIEDIEIDRGLVYLLVNNIDTTKSSGIDRISSSCLKDALLILNSHLCYIFEKSLRYGIFPNSWKIATVVPLYKGGNKEDVSNYRPISLLPIPGKILEKIVHSKLLQFFDENNTLCDQQNGFRPNRSTMDSIVNLTNDIFTSINNGDVTLAAFVDFKKAFDTVNHNILLEKLNYMGVRRQTLKWIKSYLDNRVQRTISNNIFSDLDTIKCGVPQGSILGPLFFLVYINDIKNIITKEYKYQLYADDTVIYCHGNTFTEAQEKLQSMIDKFVSWCSKNALTINIKKTKIMYFGSRNNIKKADKAVIKISNETLGNVPTYKYLGIHLDQLLNFKYHTDNLLNVVNHKLYMFSKIRRYLNIKSALAIYKSMIIPYFDYGDILFMSTNLPEIKKMNKLHIRGIRICLKTQGKIEEIELYKLANISNLSNRRIVHIRNFMYKNKNKCDIKPENCIITRENSGPTFNVSKPNSEVYKRNVFYSGSIEWNNLDSTERNINDFNAFKRLQKAWLINTYKD